MNKTIIVIDQCFDILSERSFKRGMRYVVKDILGVAKVEKVNPSW